MHRRTALITAGSVAAAVVAGATAVGANVGILSRADNGPLGELSAATTVVAATADPVAAAGPSTTTAVLPAGSGDAGSADGSVVGQDFVVDAAGTVAVVAGPDRIDVADVRPEAGWRWSATRSSPSALAVAFESDTESLVFVAELGPDGAVVARIERPSGGTARQSPPPPASPVPAPSPASGGDDDELDHRDDDHEDDDHEDDDHEDDDHEDDDHEDEEHEGWDDDD